MTSVEKTRARHHRYNTSEKGLERYRRYRDSRRTEINEKAREKRMNDPVWAVMKDIQRVAGRTKQRRHALYG